MRWRSAPCATTTGLSAVDVQSSERRHYAAVRRLRQLSGLRTGHGAVRPPPVSYAADCAVMEEFEQSTNYRFQKADISTLDFLPQCDMIFNRRHQRMNWLPGSTNRKTRATGKRGNSSQEAPSRGQICDPIPSRCQSQHPGCHHRSDVTSILDH